MNTAEARAYYAVDELNNMFGQQGWEQLSLFPPDSISLRNELYKEVSGIENPFSKNSRNHAAFEWLRDQCTESALILMHTIALLKNLGKEWQSIEYQHKAYVMPMPVYQPKLADALALDRCVHCANGRHQLCWSKECQCGDDSHRP